MVEGKISVKTVSHLFLSKLFKTVFAHLNLNYYKKDYLNIGFTNQAKVLKLRLTYKLLTIHQLVRYWTFHNSYSRMHQSLLVKPIL